MVHFSPDFKHHILTQYEANTRGYGFHALACRYGVSGGGQTIQYWYRAWDGSPASLQRKAIPGRPRLLTRAQVGRYIRTPIRRRNRSHLPVHYTELQDSIQRSTGKSISLPTIRRHGRQELQAQCKHTRKRTIQECKHTTTIACLVQPWSVRYSNRNLQRCLCFAASVV
jgi:transposase